MFKKLKLGSKLIAAFVLVSIIITMVGDIGLLFIYKLADKRLPGAQSLVTIKESMDKMVIAQRGLVIPLYFDIPSLRAQHFSMITEAAEVTEQTITMYEKYSMNSAERELWDSFRSTWGRWNRNNNEFLIAAHSKEIGSNKTPIDENMVDHFGKIMDQLILNSIDDYSNANNLIEKLITVNTITIQNDLRNAKALMIVFIVFGITSAFLIGIFITRSITKPLSKVITLLQEIGNGKLYVRMKTDYEDEIGILARELSTMAEKLDETICFALTASESVSSGSIQLSSASQNISQGSFKQANTGVEISSSLESISASIEEISTSIEQMTSSINQNADNADRTEKIAIKSSNDAKDGGIAVQQTVAAMKQIAEKITIIQEIARQTNLLSLNASIEAARAGEHGTGFAVVASAVQKLAERSQDAAEEISILSRSSVDVAEKAGNMLDKLVPDIQKTSELIAEINTSSAEQNNGIRQVNSAVLQVTSSVQEVNISVQQFNNVVQTNASASEELASTSEQLASQAAELKNRLSFFTVDKMRQRNLSRNNPSSIKITNPIHHTHDTQPVPIEPEKQNVTDSSTLSSSENGVTYDLFDEEDNNYQRM